MDSSVMEIRLQSWIPIFAAQAKSGLNKKEWCAANNVSLSAFFKWQRIYRNTLLESGSTSTALSIPVQQDLPAGPCPAFIEIPVPERIPVQATPARPEPGISITAGQFSIAISGKVDEASLTRVLKAVSNVI